jgi:hypothetical protein
MDSMGTKTSPPHITMYQHIQEKKPHEPQITIHEIYHLVALIGHDDLHTIQDIIFHSSLLTG